MMRLRPRLYLLGAVAMLLPMHVNAAAPPSTPGQTVEPGGLNSAADMPVAAATWPDIRVQVVARTSVTLSAPMSGQLIDFPLRDGDHFDKGAVIARFDCGEQESALAHAKAVLAEKGQILSADHRMRELGTGSVLDYQVAAAQDQEASADVQGATAAVGHCLVKAPFAGRIGGVSARPYQYLSVGSPMINILEDRPLELQLIAPSQWLVWLKPGTGFSVKIGETGRTYQAKVVRLSGKVDAVSQSIKVYGRLVSPSSDLLAGMSGRATFNPPTR